MFAKFMRADEELSFAMYADIKRELFRSVKGSVLEVGPGTGVNFPFIDNSCHWQGIEPNPAMHPYLHQSAEEYGFSDIGFVELNKGRFELQDNSQDFVIITLVLCSVPSVTACLAEIKRVLKPSGMFKFIEHVVDKDNLLRKGIQKTMPFTPWRYFSDGCDPGRDIASHIEEAGFSQVKIDRYKQQGEGIILAINRPHIFGGATK
jgi:ubiquinone/menaquinone biosynthesis C-methylase UbiE